MQEKIKVPSGDRPQKEKREQTNKKESNNQPVEEETAREAARVLCARLRAAG